MDEQNCDATGTWYCVFSHLQASIYNLLNKMQFVFIFILFTLFVFHQVFSSSGAKQNAGGGCHRQIKSLELMLCSDMEKIEAAPQHRLQLNLEKRLKFLMNKTNNSLC